MLIVWNKLNSADLKISDGPNPTSDLGRILIILGVQIRGIRRGSQDGGIQDLRVSGEGPDLGQIQGPGLGQIWGHLRSSPIQIMVWVITHIMLTTQHIIFINDSR